MYKYSKLFRHILYLKETENSSEIILYILYKQEQKYSEVSCHLETHTTQIRDFFIVQPNGKINPLLTNVSGVQTPDLLFSIPDILLSQLDGTHNWDMGFEICTMLIK